jgi:CRP-like cAMP-binding protein
MSSSTAQTLADELVPKLEHLVSVVKILPVASGEAAASLTKLKGLCTDLAAQIDKKTTTSLAGASGATPGEGEDSLGVMPMKSFPKKAQHNKRLSKFLGSAPPQFSDDFLKGLDANVGGGGNDPKEKKKKGKGRDEISAEILGAQDLDKVVTRDNRGSAVLDDTILRRMTAKTGALYNLISGVVASNILFNGLNSEEGEAITKAFFKISAEKNTAVIQQHEMGDNFYIVEEGDLEITVKSRTGIKSHIGEIVSGSSFGELALMYNTPRAATVTATTKCTLWALDRTTYRAICQYHQQLRRQQHIEFLVKVKILEKISSEEIKLLADSLEEEVFEKTTDIVRQGESGDHFYLIWEGTILVEVDGKVVKTLKKGDYFGEMALLQEETRAATCTAETDVRCLTLSRSNFNQRLGTYQEVFDRVEAQPEKANFRKVGDRIKANPHHLELDFEDLLIKNVIGVGSFGSVKLVVNKKTGSTYALKCLKKVEIVRGNLKEHVANERMVMMMLDHPFILKLHNTFQDNKQLYFLLEIGLGGEMFTILRECGKFTEKTARFYAAQVIIGFQVMHRMHIIYRDLKPENLILDSNGYLKIVDFGLAKVTTEKTYTLCGTPDYLAPEIILSRGHDKAVDYWALGVLIFEMCAGVAPFYAEVRDSSPSYYHYQNTCQCTKHTRPLWQFSSF